MEKLYNNITFKISKLVTKSYSTSFSISVSFLNAEMQNAIYSIYGFVRFADEIVDSFHSSNKKELLEKFERDYYEAYQYNVSLNPILHSFQQTIKKYHIADEFIQSFLKSMKIDLYKNNFKNKAEIDDYIYGSADVVGLMCLKVFTDGDEKLFDELKTPAMKLGSAFQKVNFLRDIKNDIENLERQYFPQVNKENFNENVKKEIIQDIKIDFATSMTGIKKLPSKSKLPVLIAYYYYQQLLKKIRNTPAKKILASRIRISDGKKLLLLMKAYVACKLNLV